MPYDNPVARARRIADEEALDAGIEPLRSIVEAEGLITDLFGTLKVAKRYQGENNEDTTRNRLRYVLLRLAQAALFMLNDISERNGGKKYKIEEIEWDYRQRL